MVESMLIKATIIRLLIVIWMMPLSLSLMVIANAADVPKEQHSPRSIQQEQIVTPATSPTPSQEKIPSIPGIDTSQQADSSIQEQKKTDIIPPDQGRSELTTLPETDTASQQQICEAGGGRCSNQECEVFEIYDVELGELCCHSGEYFCRKKETCTGKDGMAGICEYGAPTEIRPIIGKCNDGKFCYRVPYRSTIEALFEILGTMNKSNSDTIEKQPPAVQQDSGNASLLGAGSWFNFISGTASVLGLMLALLYPVQIHQVPPSEYRSLRWKKILITSFGVALIANSVLAFSIAFDVSEIIKDLNQMDKVILPDEFRFSIGLNYVYNHTLIYIAALIKQGLFIWIIMFIIGVMIMLTGAIIRPVATIEHKLKVTLDRLNREEQEKINNLMVIGGFFNSRERTFEELSIQEKLAYNKIIDEFKNIKIEVFKMLTGTHIQKENNQITNHSEPQKTV